MAHFARLNKDNIVDYVVVGRDEDNGMEDRLTARTGDVYKQTSYNTRGGVHYQADGTASTDQSKAFRKNFAGLGYTYDAGRDAFIPPKPFNSWVLNESTCLWDAPIQYPDDGKFYRWNEDNQQWDVVVIDGQTPVEQVP